MKKLLTIALALWMLLAFVGCSFGTPSEPVERGNIDANFYHSTFTGLHVRKPAMYEFTPDEQLAQMMDMTLEQFSDSETLTKAAANTGITDMQVVDISSGNNIIVTLEKNVYAKEKLLDKLIDNTKEQIVQMYSEIELEAEVVGETEEVKLGDVSAKRFVVSAKGTEFRGEQGYYMFLAHGYLVSVIITVVDETPLSELEALFIPAS